MSNYTASIDCDRLIYNLSSMVNLSVGISAHLVYRYQLCEIAVYDYTIVSLHMHVVDTYLCYDSMGYEDNDLN